jgi:hypothetical protein
MILGLSLAQANSSFLGDVLPGAQNITKKKKYRVAAGKQTRKRKS